MPKKGVLDGIRYNREMAEEIVQMRIEQDGRKEKDKEVHEVVDLFDKYSLDAVEEFCESEIEKQVGYALYTGMKLMGVPGAIVAPNVFSQILNGTGNDTRNVIASYYKSLNLVCVPNFPMKFGEKKYRLDFLIISKPKGKRKWKFTMLECDSFMYHSTADQLEKEKKRERALAEFENAKILRFSGREIHRNPSEVAYEVIESCLALKHG